MNDKSESSEKNVMGIDNYGIYWIDKYSGGYRIGASHAIKDGSMTSLCGIDFTNRHIDGGYQTALELAPDCKKCLAKLIKCESKQ